jgi:hypothetical protein
MDIYVRAFESRQDVFKKLKLCIMPDSTSALQHYDRAMTGLIPIYKSKWQENVVPLCIYSFVQVQ